MSANDMNRSKTSDTFPSSSTEGLGARLRRRRTALRLTLRDVARPANITEGFLSQVERDQANASVRVLQSVCEVLKLNVGDLFQSPNASSSPVLRYQDMKGLTFGKGATKLKITPPEFDNLEVLMGVFEPGGSTGDEQYVHGASEELVIVLEGQVTVSVCDNSYDLGLYDSLRYLSNQPHRLFEASGTRPARVLWMISPPTY